MDTKTSKMEVRKEVRFAVVMYGGVSLAIYIPGQQAFGHTIDALAVRNSGVPVDRKLVYIDPSPELSAQWVKTATP
jgi:hypothetical protein